MFFSGELFSKSDLNSFLFHCSSFASLKKKKSVQLSEVRGKKNSQENVVSDLVFSPELLFSLGFMHGNVFSSVCFHTCKN